MGTPTGGVVLATADDALTDAVESIAAALRVPVTRLAEVDQVLGAWSTAGVVLVGADLAAALASEGPRRRERVHLVGFDVADLGVWSMPLGAEVIPLPHGMAWLSAVLSSDAGASSPVLAVLGGCGGVGASTLAAGLALGAARSGRSVALVDADPLGGGLDLLLGAERAPGHRWPRLVAARGELGDVRELLPRVEGVTLVSMGRGATEVPGAESVQAVVGSLARHHDLVVLDAGRQPWPAARWSLRAARPALVVSGAAVRAVASTAQVVRGLGLDAPGVVVRAQPGVRVPPELVAETLGLPLWGLLPHDPALATAAEAGEPPWRARTPWARSVEALLARVWTEADDDD